MKKLSSFVLAALLFVSTFFFVTPNAFAQTTSPIPVAGTTSTPGTVSTVLTLSKIASGRTQPGATNWQQYTDYSVYVDVDTSAAQFAQTPIYVTSLLGTSNHWKLTGISAVHDATAKGFRIYLTTENDTQKLTPEYVNSQKWHVNWIGIEPFTATGSAAGSQTSSTTAQTPLPIPGKYYYLTNKKSGKVVDVEGASTADGANIQQFSKADVDQQKWALEDAGDGSYFLVSKKSNKVVGVAGGVTGNTADGANGIQWTKTANANDQKWKLEDAGDGYFYLVNKNSGKVLEVAGGSLVDKGNIQQYTKNQTDGQKWKFEAA
ncbi:MAG: RICIN domain-containing protein [Stigonema ocellatum SAG 48.90 = DSM 106950]|nr:RICIN domain-containing protein [Stigonema ocellatum SAG 48.90 = DSM 106950]